MQSLRVEILSYSAIPNRDYGNISFALSRNKNDQIVIDANLTIFKDFTGVVLQFILFIEKLKTELKSNINLCKKVDGYFGNFLAKMITEKLSDYSNINFQCPYRKVKNIFILYSFK